MTQFIGYFKLFFKYVSLQTNALCCVFLSVYHCILLRYWSGNILVYVSVINVMLFQHSNRRCNHTELLNSTCKKMIIRNRCFTSQILFGDDKFKNITISIIPIFLELNFTNRTYTCDCASYFEFLYLDESQKPHTCLHCPSWFHIKKSALKIFTYDDNSIGVKIYIALNSWTLESTIENLVYEHKYYCFYLKIEMKMIYHLLSGSKRWKRLLTINKPEVLRFIISFM